MAQLPESLQMRLVEEDSAAADTHAALKPELTEAVSFWNGSSAARSPAVTMEFGGHVGGHADDPDDPDRVVLAGDLLKENPGRWRFSQYQKRYIALISGQLHWWADEKEAREEGLTGSRGCVDFAFCTCEVVEEATNATTFSIRPLDREGWRMQRLTGAAEGRVLSFDAKGSPFERGTWVRSIVGEIARCQPSPPPAKSISVDDFLTGRGHLAPRRTLSSPNRLRNHVYNIEGQKLRKDRSRKSFGVPSIDSVLEKEGDSDGEGEGIHLYIGDMVARNDPLVLTQRGITRVVDCLEPEAFPDIERYEYEGVDYLYYPIAMWEECEGSRTEAGVSKILAPLFAFVTEGLDKGESVLIHCFAGAHRGGAAGIACVMHISEMGADDATAAVQAKRSAVEPFANMQKLLARFNRARGKDVVVEAIAAAKERGPSQAAADVFTEEVLELNR